MKNKRKNLKPSKATPNAPMKEKKLMVGGDGKGRPAVKTKEAEADEEKEAVRSRTGEKRKKETGAKGVSSDGSFPIVGIGASAGGLAAFETLFAHMPPDRRNGIAFVIVQHLDPNHKSILTELVRRYTTMDVFEVKSGMEVEPNCAYIIPPNKDMVLRQGKLMLVEPTERRGLRLPIDYFFRSLAQDRGEHGIGIILSGNGTDGTLGLRAIKEAGGMGLVQEPKSAEFDGMPRSAIAAGLADFILAPEEMPKQLMSYVARSQKLRPPPATAPVPADVSGWLMKITAMLRAHNGHDLSYYKQNTVRRRVERRMAVNQIDTFEDYVRLLRQTRSELDALFRELLIGVTSFFRDGHPFDALREMVLPAILKDRPPAVPVRIWVAGCSTGEEAYSLAMLVQETCETLGRDCQLQMFATDVDHEAIERARAGIYPASIAADVSPERLGRFFSHTEKDFYRVKKTLREQVIFAEQDVVRDPPFSKLDLISCRNMLIYMEPVLQRRLIPVFHYALAHGGFLMLGTSESIGEFNSLFAPIDRKWKIYRKKEPLPGTAIPVTVPHLPFRRDKSDAKAGTLQEKKDSMREIVERALLREHSPACIAVSEHGEILYIHGRSGKYLELPHGDASMSILRSAREGLKVELANGLRKVLSTRHPVRYEGLHVRTNGGFEPVNVDIELAEGSAGEANIVIITFTDVAPKFAADLTPIDIDSPPQKSTPPDEKDNHILALERELRLKTETLQSTVEELEASNEELKSTNEELQSTNEELQSTNEELETSKEELQSVNEELTTVNNELQQKMDGLARANNDMNNLLAGTGIGMLFVDHGLHIQRFTPATTKIIKLIHSDVGRPVSDLVSNLENYDTLGADVKKVLDTLIPAEREVRTRAGGWFLMRILPYRTVENVIEGAVLTFVDIGGQKRAEEKLVTLTQTLEKRVEQRIAELATANKSLATEIGQREKSAARRAADVSAMRRLHDLTFRIVRRTEPQKLLETALDAAIELTGAQKGAILLADGDVHDLTLKAQRGFDPGFLDHFGAVSRKTNSPSGEVLRRGKTVSVPDILESPIFKDRELRDAMVAQNVRALQSTPVIARDGRLLAVFSVHWKDPHKFDTDTTRLVDLLARQLADLLEAHETDLKSPKTSEN